MIEKKRRYVQGYYTTELLYPKWEPPVDLVLTWESMGLVTKESVNNWILNNGKLEFIKDGKTNRKI
jgi:hypothetical protein